MKTEIPHRRLTSTRIILLALVAFFAFTDNPDSSDTQSDVTAESKAPSVARTAPVALTKPQEPDAQIQTTWEKREFSPRAKEIVQHLSEGLAVTLQVEGIPEQRFRFRPTRVTTEDFVITDGANNQIPMDVAVFLGRSFAAGASSGTRVSAAAVGDTVVYSMGYQGQEYLVYHNTETGESHAQMTSSPDKEPGTCTNDHDHSHHSQHHADCGNAFNCSLDLQGQYVTSTSQSGAGEFAHIDASVEFQEVGFAASPSHAVNNKTGIDHPHFRLGPKYDASLLDLPIIWVSDRSQTGPSSNLQSKAASYLSYAATSSDMYERQLGLRLVLQELILIPNDTGTPNPVSLDYGSKTEQQFQSEQRDQFSDWVLAERPQDIYQWGNISCWTRVGGRSGGIIGVGQSGRYGKGTKPMGITLNEFGWGPHLFVHEFGHGLQAGHTENGIMTSALGSISRESFHSRRAVSDPNYLVTAAHEIYNFLTNGKRPHGAEYALGPAALRNPYEVPFAIDDVLSTAQGVPVAFNPLTNDETSVLYGATNSLSLVEVGSVFPSGAGAAEVSGDEIIFTPSASYTGEAWFTYTMQGSVGNDGRGWLHSADVSITVGGDNTEPSLNPATSLREDFYDTDFTGSLRFNPILNDIGSGYLSPGDIDIVLSPDDTSAESYSGQSFYLVNAVVLQGSGSLELETRHVVDDGSSATGNNGYMTYSPTGSEQEVIIQYTVRDANDQEFTSTATLRAFTGPAITNFSVDGLTAELTHPFDENNPGDQNLIYEWSLDLANWYAADGIDGPATAGAPKVSAEIVTHNGSRTVSFTSTTELEKAFYRIRVPQD